MEQPSDDSPHLIEPMSASKALMRLRTEGMLNESEVSPFAFAFQPVEQIETDFPEPQMEQLPARLQQSLSKHGVLDLP